MFGCAPAWVGFATGELGVDIGSDVNSVISGGPWKAAPLAPLAITPIRQRAPANATSIALMGRFALTSSPWP